VGGWGGRYILANAAIGMLEPTFPLWCKDKFGSPSWVPGTLFLAASGGFLLGAPLVGTYGNRIGRPTCAVGGMLLIVVGLVFVAVPENRLSPTESIPALFFVGFGVGAAEASLNPLLAYIVDTRCV
jgi:MFS family permease